MPLRVVRPRGSPRHYLLSLFHQTPCVLLSLSLPLPLLLLLLLFSCGLSSVSSCPKSNCNPVLWGTYLRSTYLLHYITVPLIALSRCLSYTIHTYHVIGITFLFISLVCYLPIPHVSNISLFSLRAYIFLIARHTRHWLAHKLSSSFSVHVGITFAICVSVEAAAHDGFPTIPSVYLIVHSIAEEASQIVEREMNRENGDIAMPAMLFLSPLCRILSLSLSLSCFERSRVEIITMAFQYFVQNTKLNFNATLTN